MLTLEEVPKDLEEPTLSAREYLCPEKIREMANSGKWRSRFRVGRIRRAALKRIKHYDRVNERGKCT